MSIKVSSHLWQHSPLGGTELLLMLAIADFADDEGRAYPSVDTLAKKIRMSERHTRRVIAETQRIGALLVELNAGPHGCNIYHVQLIHISTDPDNLSGVTQASGTPDMGGRGPLTHTSVTPDNHVPQTIKEPSLNRYRTGKSLSKDLWTTNIYGAVVKKQ